MARRKLIWARQPLAITTLTNINASQGGSIESNDLLAGFRSEAGLLKGPVGLTAMRIRLHINFDLTTDGITNTVRQFGGIYYGVRVFDTTELSELDVTELPNRGPYLDPHADWMTWGRVPAKTNIGTNVVGWEEVDVRSMRKIEELGQTLGLVLQATTGSATGVLQTITASTSVLFALP